MNTLDFEGWLSTSAAARLCAVSQQSVNMWVRNGRLTSVMTPFGARLVRSDQVEEIARERGVYVPAIPTGSQAVEGA